MSRHRPLGECAAAARAGLRSRDWLTGVEADSSLMAEAAGSRCSLAAFIMTALQLNAISLDVEDTDRKVLSMPSLEVRKQ
jgi:hypothetical protein